MTMILYTIHDRPADFPDLVVVTRDLIRDGHPVPRRAPGVLPFRTVDAAREAIRSWNPNAFPIPRDPQDSPAIVETWI